MAFEQINSKREQRVLRSLKPAIMGALLLSMGSGSAMATSFGDFELAGSPSGSVSLGATKTVWLQSTTPHAQTALIDDLYDALVTDLLTDNITKLVFGVGVNETGASPGEEIDLTALSMVFGDDGTYTGPDTDPIFTYVDTVPGNSGAEGTILVDLGFDFFDVYSDGSVELLTTTATFLRGSNGFERIFFSAGLTAVANDCIDNPDNCSSNGGPPQQQVSEPSVLALFGMSLLGVGLYRRRRRSNFS